MAAPNALILSGYGINCERETAHAFELTGSNPKIVNINDLIDGHDSLGNYQILVFPGGFSYGDDTGSGKAFANRMRNNHWEELLKFAKEDKLILGICNGFQILTNLGLLSGLDGNYGNRDVALTHNDFPRYQTRWIDLEVNSKSPWLEGLDTLSMPIAHGEGKFVAEADVLKKLNERGMIALRYFRGDICEYQNLEGNPNGSIENIAGIADESGRIIGMMPHPERAIFFTQRPDWPLKNELMKRKGEPIPRYNNDNLRFFENAAKYFK